MSEFIATAFVRIKPDPTSLGRFSADLKKAIVAETAKKPITIPVTPTLVSFRKKIQAELSAVTPFKVPVEPVLAKGFKKKLEGQIRAAAAGISIPIQGTVVGGAGGVGGTPGRPEETPSARLQRLTDTRASAELALNRAKEKGLDLDERRRRVDVALSRAQTAVNATDREAVAVSHLKNAELTKAVAHEAALAEAQLKGVLAEKQRLKAAIEKRAADKIAAQTAEQRLAVEDALAATQLRLIGIEEAGALKTTKIASARARLVEANSIATASEKLHERALELKDKQLIESAAALKAKADAEVLNQQATVRSAIAEEQAARSAATRATRQATGLRGAGATGLAALGARGATLAASGEFLAGAAVATGLFKSVQLASNLEQELNVLQVTTDATADEMERAAETARQLGQDITLPTVSAGDAAKAMTELAKAGLSVEDTLNATRGVLQLATAADIDNAEATQLVASALNAFSLEGKEAVRVADLLTGAANESQGSIQDMGVSLQQAAAVARQAGIPVEDTVALLTLLARNGLRGSDAGTSLRTSLIKLIRPTKNAQEAIGKLDIEIRNAAGNIRPEVYGDIADALADMSAKQRDATLALIFGQDAMRAAAILGREGASGLNAMRDATQEMGLASEVAGARTKGFKGDVEALKNASEGLGSSLGRVLVPALSVVVKSLTFWTTFFGDAVNKTLDLADAVASYSDDVDQAVSSMKDLLDSVDDFGSDLPVVGGLLDELSLEKLDPRRVGEFLDEVTKGIPVLDRFFDPISKPTGAAALKEADEAIKRLILGTGSMSEITALARELREELDSYGDTEPPDDLVKALALLDEILKREAKTLKDGLSPALKVTIVDMDGFSVSLADAASRANALNNAITLTPFLLSDMADAASRAAAAAKETPPTATFALPKDVQLALAEAAGDPQEQLRILNEQLAIAKKHQAAQQKLFDEAPGPNRATALENAANRVTQLQGAIEQIESQLEADAKAAADKIADARNKADQAFLDAIGLKRSRRENAILIAEGTAGLADDIRTHQKLRDFLKKARDEAQKTIKDAKTRAEAVASLTADIIQENNTIDDLQRSLQDSLRERFELRVDITTRTGTLAQIKRLFAIRIKQLTEALADAKKGSQIALELKQELLNTQAELRDLIHESFELDISFAQTTENRNAEIAARERFIKQLQAEQKLVKRGTLEWKRLRNLIAEQREAIEDLRGEERDLFAEMTFEFLTRQQGFAATVMSNLLPSAVLSGSVGGRSSPTSITAAASTSPGSSGVSSKDPPWLRALNIRSQALNERYGLGGTLAQSLTDQRTATGRGGALGGAFEPQAAAALRGGTPAQFSTIIHLLTQMVNLLAHSESRSKHPEAKRRQAQGGAAMDTQ